MTVSIEAHGGELIQRGLRGEQREDAAARAEDYPGLRLTETELADLRCIGTGVYSPLTGFMTRHDYWCTIADMRLANGLPWTLPITLPVERQFADTLRIGQFVRLEDEAGHPVGTMRIEDVFERDLEEEALHVFRTRDPAHPGVKRLFTESPVLVGGDIHLFEHEITAPQEHRDSVYALTPAQTRAEFARRGWRRIVGFQTRNPVHRAHEYIQKCALEIVDGLLLHPLVGTTKDDDVPAAIRLRSYEVLLSHYYPEDRVLLAAFPAAMRYAGPREAVFHALCRKNYGCTHFIVGRDHAGVGGYYGTYDAQRIFDEFRPDELGIMPLLFEHAFYCRRCAGMATTSTCAHGAEERVTLSGTAVRSLLRAGELPPAEFTRPEVAQVLAEALVASSSE